MCQFFWISLGQRLFLFLAQMMDENDFYIEANDDVIEHRQKLQTNLVICLFKNIDV